jgi:hypothetical protein
MNQNTKNGDREVVVAITPKNQFPHQHYLLCQKGCETFVSITFFDKLPIPPATNQMTSSPQVILNSLITISS